MKKFLTTLSLVLVMALSVTSLAGCGATDEFGSLESAFNNAVNTSENFDNVSAEDLSTSTIDGITTDAVAELSVSMCSMDSSTEFAGPSSNQGPSSNNAMNENIQAIISKHQQIRESQEGINSNKLQARTLFADIKAKIRLIRDSEYQLTEEDKAVLDAYITEIDEITTSLRGTIGQVFAKMRNLRGQYNRANADRILTVYGEICEQMQLRLDGVNRLVEIENELLAYLDGIEITVDENVEDTVDPIDENVEETVDPIDENIEDTVDPIDENIEETVDPIIEGIQAE